MNAWRKTKTALLKLLHLRDTPKRTAAAFAIGVFFGMSPVTPPFLGLQTAMAILSAFAFKLNRLAAVVGTFVSNPFTFVPIYMFGTSLGAMVLRYDVHINPSAIRGLSLKEVFGNGKEIATAFFVGNFISAAIAAVVSYFVLYWLIVRYRRARQARPHRHKAEEKLGDK